MNYKINDTCIEGYEGDKLVSILYISCPVSRSKLILQYEREGTLIKLKKDLSMLLQSS